MSHRFRRPCLDCGTLSYGNRCDTHQTEVNKKRERKRVDTPQRREKKRRLYNTNYQKQARWIRQTASICHICGEGTRPGDPWEADHITPGDPGSPLAPAHRSCNRKKSNKHE